jgi:hypothetical protein
MPPESVRSASTPQRLTPQLLLGVLVIAAGLLMTFDNLGLVHAEQYMQFWPGGVIAIGLLKLWHSRDGAGGAFGGLLFTLIGTWLLLEQTSVVNVNVRDMWPALLVLAGGFLVWQGLSRPRPRPLPAAVDAGATSNALATLNAIAVLGGVSRGSNSAAFRGGEVTAVLGGCEIDLRQAAIDGEAVIEVFALCGGLEIRVPDDWTVESRVVPVLGGVDDKTRPPQGASRHRLVLRGTVVMGGIEIKN